MQEIQGKIEQEWFTPLKREVMELIENKLSNFN